MEFRVPFHRVQHVDDDLGIVIIGAGVLPFFVCDTRGVCFLLGKEQFVPDWNGSLCWSGFEGGNKGTESPERNAAREFLEETMGAVDQSQTAGDVDTLPKAPVNGLSVHYSNILETYGTRGWIPGRGTRR